MGTLSGVMSRASTDGGGRSEVTDADLVLFMEALVDAGDVGNVVDEEEEGRGGEVTWELEGGGWRGC